MPDRKKVMLVALLLSLALGFGGSIFLESMDQSLHDVRAFQALYKVQILGTLPVGQSREYLKEQARRRATVIGGLVTFAVALSVFLIVYHAKIRNILNI